MNGKNQLNAELSRYVFQIGFSPTVAVRSCIIYSGFYGCSYVVCNVVCLVGNTSGYILKVSRERNQHATISQPKLSLSFYPHLSILHHIRKPAINCFINLVSTHGTENPRQHPRKHHLGIKGDQNRNQNAMFL